MKPVIDPDALHAHMQSLQASFASVTPEVWAQVQRQHAIDKHNAAVDAKRAKRRQIKAIAKQARIKPSQVMQIISRKAKE